MSKPVTRSRLGRLAEQAQILTVLLLLAGFAGLALWKLLELVAGIRP